MNVALDATYLFQFFVQLKCKEVGEMVSKVDMKYSEAGFRLFDHHFMVVPKTEELVKVAGEFPGIDEAEYLLTYGYIDHEAGMTLEVLATADRVVGDLFHCGETNVKVIAKIRIGSIMEEEVVLLDDTDGQYFGHYENKLEYLRAYEVNTEVAKTRKMEFLDPFRSPEYPDDVMVYLLKEGMQPEGCWVRIEGLGEHALIGTLLNEPKQNFAYHAGDQIAFFVHETKENSIVLCANMNVSKKITAEELEDGSVLEEAIHVFHKERNQEHLLDILEILRDSYVWIPCNAVMNEEDQKRILDMVSTSEDVIGETFTIKENMRLVPDILQNGEAFFFPVFSNSEAMGNTVHTFLMYRSISWKRCILPTIMRKNLPG